MSDPIDKACDVMDQAIERIAELEAQNAELSRSIKELEPRAAFGDQCIQDDYEGALVPVSVVKELSRQLANTQSELALSDAEKALAEKALAEERARLDWLNSNPHAVAFAQGYRSEPSGWVWRDKDKASHCASSLLNAIDAARAAGEPE